MIAALVLIIVSRIGDGLDGSVARASTKTDFGGYLDITLDFVFYGAIPLGFVFFDPAANGLAGAALIFSFYVNGASFLAYAIVAEKRGLFTDARGVKSIYFTTGLAEASETFFVFGLFCLWPGWFVPVAWVFADLPLHRAFADHTGARHVSRRRLQRPDSARSKSSTRSSASSMPTESRTIPGLIPSSSRASSARFLCVVVAGWVIRLLASPRLLEIRRLERVLKANAASCRPSVRTQTRVEPPFICRG
jgi:phosphatidylglycerophosphate synthase